MARIIGGIGTSHVPTIAMAFDKGKQDDPGLAAAVQGLRGGGEVAGGEEARRAVLLLQRPRHHVLLRPLSDLRARRERRNTAIADEGLGARKIPPLKGHAALSRHIARSLVDDEFDLTIFQDLPIDHGLHSPLTMMWPTQPDWPGQGDSARGQRPAASAAQADPLLQLGQAIGKAIESYPEDLKVVMVGTGGLSHQMIGERAGFNDEKWDREFLDLIERDPGAAGEDDDRRLRAPRRQRGRGSDHVADHARRADARTRASCTRTTTCR